MPFTPFHVGPGLLLKSLAPKRSSIVAFTLSNVAVDLETLYHIVRHEYPLHRWAHTFVAATAIGVAVGALYGVIVRRYARTGDASPLAAEAKLVPAVIGGLLGGATHPLLDGMMHADTHPFMPFSQANPFLGLMSPAGVMELCILTGVAGFFIWALALARGSRRP